MNIKTLAALVAAAGLTAGFGGPASASQDIPWTWNSGDHDSKAQFKAYGEHLQGAEYSGSGYIDYEYANVTGLTWNIPGSTDGTVKDLNLTIDENKYFGLQVCEEKTGLPDDCSSWKQGVS